MINNKKGFTLIELLAAITILGILMGIAVTAVTKIIENGKREHYNSAEKNMVLAAQSYVQKKRSALPKAIGLKTTVKLKTLVEKKYIQPIKDYSKNECNQNNSYVQIYKYSQSNYSYTAYLDCPKYNTKEDSTNNSSPEISLQLMMDNNNSTAKVKITGNDKIMSYTYIIYKDNTEVYNSGNVSVKNNKESADLTIDLNKYTPGNVKVFVSATNTYGNTTTKTEGKQLEDTLAPECIIKQEDKSTTQKPWTNGNRTITIGCSDSGSGCEQSSYTKTFTESTKIGTIKIKDKTGKTTDCKVSVYIDKTPPNLIIKVYKKTGEGNTQETSNSYPQSSLLSTKTNSNISEDWKNYKYFFDITESTDEHSGIDKNQNWYTWGYNSDQLGDNADEANINKIVGYHTEHDGYFSLNNDGIRYAQLTIKDNFGNTRTQTIRVKIDTVKPTFKNIYTQKVWDQENKRYERQIMIEGTDDRSGIASQANLHLNLEKCYCLTSKLEGFYSQKILEDEFQPYTGYSDILIKISIEDKAGNIYGEGGWCKKDSGKCTMTGIYDSKFCKKQCG